MWAMVIGAFLIVFFMGMCYLTVAVARFGWIRRLAGGKKLPGYLIAFLLLAIFTVAASVLFSVVNAVIMGLHFVFFFLLFGIVVKLATRKTKRSPKLYWQGWLAIATSVIYLGIGYFLCAHVGKTEYHLGTPKEVGTIKIALIADAHLGTTFDGEGFEKHLQTIEKQEPDLLLIAGDFVDDSTTRADFEKACEALGKMNLKYGVWYSFGNHDAGYYGTRDFRADDIRSVMKNNGIQVLEDEFVCVDDRFYVVGRKDGHDRGRKNIQALLADVDPEKYVIVINHEPNDYENEAQSVADLVVSGHTHGGQLFPWTILSRLVKADDLVYGHESRSGTDFIVTSGISDWEILFKMGTRSEYVIITVEEN